MRHFTAPWHPSLSFNFHMAQALYSPLAIMWFFPLKDERSISSQGCKLGRGSKKNKIIHFISIDICHCKMVWMIMKLLKMYNLCVNELAPVRFFPYPPQAIVKLKPLARSVGNINLSAWAYQYLITAKVLLLHAFRYGSLMRLHVSEAFKTHICIRKMTNDKVNHLLPVLSVSLSYNHLSAFCLLLSGGLEGSGCWLSA